MQASTLYWSSPVAIQNLLVSAYGLLLYWRRLSGRRHRQEMSRIREVERYSLEQIRAWQSSELRKLVRSAYHGTDHYRQRWVAGRIDPERITALSDLERLPILEKQEVRENASLLVNRDLPGSQIVINTSGTTGMPLRVICDREALQRNYAHFYRFRERIGIARKARCATFAGRTIVAPDRKKPPFWRYNAVTNSTLFSSYHLSEGNIPAYIDKLRRLQPELIDSYPSAVFLLARRLLATRDKSIRPGAIITSSETLLDGQRMDIEQAFGCRVHDQYGSAEMAAFIAQCELGTYHVWPTYGIAEVLVGDRPARPGEAGELVCTGFINNRMPFIRYRTGDWAVQGDGRCACGLSYPTIVSIEGRMDDIIVTPDGRQVGRLDPVFKGIPERVINEAQIAQVARDRVVMRYVPGEAFDAGALDTVQAELEGRLGPLVRVEMKRVGHIPRTSSGKFRAVVSELKSRA